MILLVPQHMNFTRTIPNGEGAALRTLTPIRNFASVEPQSPWSCADIARDQCHTSDVGCAPVAGEGGGYDR